MFRKCYVIPTQSTCNANCVFCVTRELHYSKEQEFLVINSKFRSNIDLLKKLGIKKFEITGGGEPFLNNRLQDIINELRKHNPSFYIKLYTNAKILKKVSGIDELNISIVHWDKDINNNFMRLRNPHELFDILEFFQKNGKYKIRLSIPLIKGGIDNASKVKELVKKTSLYVDEYVLRPLLEKTPKKDDYYVDFDFEHPRVEVDRVCSCYNKVLVWWSDNNFYTRWDLSEKFYEVS